jgi:hypothetical protein|tara:strand:+ start:9 stop:560 length:552 start_codon:yes stop_codon:yes gene_type:complete
MIIKSNFKIKNKNKINKYLNSLFYEKHSSVENGFSTFNTDISKENNFPLKLFKPLFDKIVSLLKYEYDIIDFWVNIYNNKGCVIKHNHEPKPELKSFKSFSGVFYFKKPNNSGNLFINDKLYKIKENDILIFSPYDFHYSEKNLSNKKRIIFSFNATKGLAKIWDPFTQNYLYLAKRKGNNVH